MHATNISFSFREQVEDPDYVTEGMWPFVSAYAQTHPTSNAGMLANNGAPDYGKEASFPMFGGNFEIRFYKFRWGDAPLRKATVYMLLDVAQEVHQMYYFVGRL
ncbi:hypothetical protein B0H14DRAFT_2989791 [Mycena olivaceomarginata]|nr:hypothetical protein B0H14DRAFT_2989791 [Mycena olivaceomarginata]